MPRWTALALFFVAFPAWPQADADFETYFVNDPAKWGRVTRIVDPAYPREAIERRVRGHVDVKGIVNWGGVMESIEYVPSTPQASVFVAAVAKVMPQWRFNVVPGMDCLPTATPVTARIWFELDGDKKVQVTQAPLAAAVGRAEFKALHRVEPLYPYAMQRMGWQASVFSRLEIDAHGNVVKATAAAFPKQRGVNLERFEKAVVEALVQWKFPGAPAGLNAVRTACFDVYFRIKG